MEDEQITELFFQRSQETVSILSAKYGRLCAGIAGKILNNSLDAEECVNDACLALWNAIPPERPAPLRTYLCRVVRNLALKRYRDSHAAKRGSQYDAALDELAGRLPAAETAESLCTANELAGAINRFLASLDRRDRVIFVRRCWFADSTAGIAALLRIRPNHAAVRLSRTRKKRKLYLKKEGLWS